MSSPGFKPGKNIAIKIPKVHWDKTVEFYRETLGLKVIEESEKNIRFEWGGMSLWLDLVENYSQADVWLDITTPDTKAAADFLRSKGAPRRDEVEELPPGLDGFWISNPAGIINLIYKEGQD